MIGTSFLSKTKQIDKKLAKFDFVELSKKGWYLSDYVCICVLLFLRLRLYFYWKIICFTRGHIDTYLWWNRSPNYRILFFACFTNSSRSPLWNTSKSQKRLLDSLLISTLQILGNSRWCPREMAYLREHSKTIRMFTHCV